MVHSQLMAFLENHNFFNDRQHSFCSGGSQVGAEVEILEPIIESIDKRESYS